ncbi:sensor histidine kinase [Psychrobacillus lasiicapitis]|uniref:Signal transduction histidine-protein kinase/phosphatase DegS n=1 Tax=Psychrobacillus lasiicapitis TaxID=1636719 RepID=A0A544TE39_9BACI|nr:sensor histidine kinase [Psychrobacillus lasiicapitis]TQR15705.1 histidine kinase [Psychrobacillus lasiicapitis]GGA18646.1 signal transduction histidine-protein kinase/phosphatase DegS [Psychrobacillus lasiicapitis]
MTKKNLNTQSLDVIFDRMVEVMDHSKRDIFIISEQSRQSFEEMKVELEIIRSNIEAVILEGDTLEANSRIARNRLAEVSKNFDSYDEPQVRSAYETANEIQIKLLIKRNEEKQLRLRRDELERRLQGLLEMIERADQLVNQVNIVMNYLTSDLKDVGEALENAKIKQDFTLKIIEAQEEERKRLSREIHDGPAQMLANVLLRTDLINLTYEQRGGDEAMKEIIDLKSMVRNALSEVRRIIYDLRPMALDDLGLIPTLRKYISTIEEYNPTKKINFQAFGEEKRMQTNFEVAIFRLVQECLTNSIKHGKFTEAWVKVEWLQQKMNIIVKDNGVGFDPQVVKEKSFGLIGMQERVDLLEGTMKIISSPGKGATILFGIPIKEE